MFSKERIGNREQLSGKIYVSHEKKPNKQKKKAETDSSI